MMRSLLAFVLCLLATPLIAQETEQPIKTTVCQIKADPMSFNKKVVEVSGYATHGFEDSMFEDPTCFEGSKWPGIWMEYGGTASTDTMFCCGFKPGSERPKPLVVQDIQVALVRDQLFERMDKLLHSKPRKDVSVRSTVIGRVFVQPPQMKAYPNHFLGYGHMGCCMLLAIEKVESVESKKAEQSIFEMAKAFEKKNPPPSAADTSGTAHR